MHGQVHGQVRAAQLRELTSHTRLAPVIIKGYLLWWEKRRYDIHRLNLNEITQSWDFGKVWFNNFYSPQNSTEIKWKKNRDRDLVGILSRSFR